MGAVSELVGPKSIFKSGMRALPEFPAVSPGDELPEHQEPSFAQMLAHARLLLSWRDSDYFEKRRELMDAERFVID